MDGIGYPNFKRTWPIYHILGYFICIRIISLYILIRLLVINGHEYNYNPILAGSQLQPQSSLLQGAAPPPARSSFPHAAQWRQIVMYNLSSMAMNGPWPDIPQEWWPNGPVIGGTASDARLSRKDREFWRVLISIDGKKTTKSPRVPGGDNPKTS